MKLQFLERFIAKYVAKIKKAAPRFELGIKDLQSSALPLGHAADTDKISSQQYINSRKSNYLLIICNGHGEDLIALEIIKELLKITKSYIVEVMPLVGTGEIFDDFLSERIIKIGYQKVLPSGGFSNQSFLGFLKDLRGGMITYLLKNWFYLRSKPKGYKILAVGDLLPLFFAWSAKRDFGFIGTPKSDYSWMSGPGSSISDFYHKLKGSEWDPWEMQLMRTNLCKCVIVRDELTSKNLHKKDIDAIYLGNPMMDFMQEIKLNSKNIDGYEKLILLIGSRFPEAYYNLDMFLSYLDDILFHSKSLIFTPLSSSSNSCKIEKIFIKHNYHKDSSSRFLMGEQSVWIKKNITLLVGKNKFQNWANLADIGLANAGTATEQICGLGKPVLSLPRKGPQFTKSFAIRQQRLLGGSVIACMNKKIFQEKLLSLLQNKEFRFKQGKLGKERMGAPGASAAIANFINLKLLR